MTVTVSVSFLSTASPPPLPLPFEAYVLAHVPATTAPKHPVLRYHRLCDQQLHFCSLLLKLHLLPSRPEVTNLGKPFLPATHLTFSLSHHHHTTVLSSLSSPSLVVGCDVVHVSQRSNLNEGFDQFLSYFDSIFTPDERDQIWNLPVPEAYAKDRCVQEQARKSECCSDEPRR